MDATAGFANLTARASAVPGEERLERPQLVQPDEMEELLPRVREVLAEVVGDLLAGPLHLQGEQLAEQRPQEPQPVPAVVAALIAPTEDRSWQRIASQMTPLATFWQVQMVAALGSASTPGSAAAPSMRGRMSCSARRGGRPCSG